MLRWIQPSSSSSSSFSFSNHIRTIRRRRQSWRSTYSDHCSYSYFSSNNFSTLSQQQSKEHVNVGCIGDEKHGKSSLVQAICKILSDSNQSKYIGIDFMALNKSKLIMKKEDMHNFHNLEYETLTRHYLHCDNPGAIEYLGNLIVGSTQLDCIVICISVMDGIGTILKEQLLILKHINIHRQHLPLIVFVNKLDHPSFDSDFIPLVELELKEYLHELGFDVSKIPFIRGSALAAIESRDTNIGRDSILSLIKELDEFTLSSKLSTNKKNMEPEEPKDFIMPIQIVYNLTGVGVAAIGKVLQGTIHSHDEVSLYGLCRRPSTSAKNSNQKKNTLETLLSKNLTASAGSLKLFNKSVKQGSVGDYLGIALHSHNINSKNIKRGMTLIIPHKNKKISLEEDNDQDSEYNNMNHWKHGWTWICELTLLSEKLGGRHTPIQSGFMPTFYFLTTEVTGTLDFSSSSDDSTKNNNDTLLLNPGETISNVKITFMDSCIMWKGLQFIIRESGRTIGYGTILEYVDTL